jgi:hypothetical protein
MALEGAGHWIKVNPVAPVAYTRMMATGPGAVPGLSAHSSVDPSRVAATVALLAHERCPSTGEIL